MKQVQVTINDKLYTVREARVGDVLQHMHLITENPSEFQRYVAQASVMHEDGTPMGDRLMDIGLSDYLALVPAVMEACGFTGKP